MSQNFLYLLFCFCISVEITSSTTVVTTSPNLATLSLTPVHLIKHQSTASSVQTSSLTSSSIPALSSSTHTVVASQFTTSSVQISSLPSRLTPALSSSTHTLESSQTASSSFKTSTLSPTTSFAATNNSAASSGLNTSVTSSAVPPVSTFPSKSTTVILESTASLSSSPTSSVQGTRGTEKKTSYNMQIVGLVVAYLVALVTVVAILFLISRIQMNPTKGRDGGVSTIWPAATAQTTEPEVGITHQAFVGDSDNPINVTLDPEVKVLENAGFTDTAL